jgi:hypothetical protein
MVLCVTQSVPATKRAAAEMIGVFAAGRVSRAAIASPQRLA